MLKKMLTISAAALLAAGCSTTTNLTPSQMPKSDSGLYTFEFVFDSTATSVARDSIQPYLLIGGEQIPMQRTALVTNRWEVMAPIPEGKDSVNYQFKVNYQWKDLGRRRENSKLSDVYELRITD